MSVQRKRLRLFLDSNVLTGGLTGGMVARWGLDKAILSLCAAHVFKLVLAETVRLEVETNLLHHSTRLPPRESGLLLEEYEEFLRLAEPERVVRPDPIQVKASRNLIAHLSDVPVLLSAIQADPDWLLTHNTKHFTEQVAQDTGLRIATPIDFFREIAVAIQESRRY